MKKKYLLFITIISLLMMSCSGHFFNPRYYYNKKGSVDSEQETPDTAPETPPEQVPEHEDPFKNGDWNDPSYGGYEADKFKTWLFKASFQDDKLPIYNFFEDESRSWIPGAADWNNIQAEYYQAYDGENQTGSIVGNVSINKMKIYKYPSDNPLYGKEGYLEGRIDRFNFYSINGNAGGVDLKQYLIAVDTYSKFIFAFGAITEVKKHSITGDLIPMAFEAIEKHADKRPFFEYDPIGYVKADGTVVLYQHYRKEFVAAPTEYQPKIHSEFESMAKHEENGQGSSPYLKVDASSIDPSSILTNFQNKQYGIRDKLTLYTYKFDSTANTVTLTIDHFYNGNIKTDTYKFSKVAGLTAAEYTNSSGETIIINGIDDYNKLKDGGSFEYILNYSDDGPLFYYRAAGKNYTEIDGSGDKYVFSGDGKTLYHYNKSGDLETYTYVSENGKDQAKYKKDAVTTYTLRLSENSKKDDTLFWSGLWGNSANDNESRQDYVEINGGFTDYVSGKIFKYRDTTQWTPSYPFDENYNPDGRSLILKTYSFSEGGKTLEVKEETWQKPELTKTITYNLKDSSDKSATYTGNTGDISLEINDSGSLVQSDIVVGIESTSFIDNGPIFTDRVRDAIFFKAEKEYISWPAGDIRNLKYQFNENGTEVNITFEKYEWFSWKGKNYVYKLARYDNEASQNFTAVFEYDGNYYRISLTDSEGYSTIKSSETGATIDAPSTIMKYEAYRQ